MKDGEYFMYQYVLYFNTTDYPDKYAIRRWGMKKGDDFVPLNVVFSGVRLTDAMDFMEWYGLCFLERSENDDPCILGVYI